MLRCTVYTSPEDMSSDMSIIVSTQEALAALRLRGPWYVTVHRNVRFVGKRWVCLDGGASDPVE